MELDCLSDLCMFQSPQGGGAVGRSITLTNTNPVKIFYFYLLGNQFTGPLCLNHHPYTSTRLTMISESFPIDLGHLCVLKILTTGLKSSKTTPLYTCVMLVHLSSNN